MAMTPAASTRLALRKRNHLSGLSQDMQKRSDPGRLGQVLDDITLGICILGVLGSVGCGVAAFMGLI